MPPFNGEGSPFQENKNAEPLLSRRDFLKGVSATVGGAVLSGSPSDVLAQQEKAEEFSFEKIDTLITFGMLEDAEKRLKIEVEIEKELLDTTTAESLLESAKAAGRPITGDLMGLSEATKQASREHLGKLHYYLSRVSELQKKHQDALNYAEEALRYDPKNEEYQERFRELSRSVT